MCMLQSIYQTPSVRTFLASFCPGRCKTPERATTENALAHCKNNFWVWWSQETCPVFILGCLSCLLTWFVTLLLMHRHGSHTGACFMTSRSIDPTVSWSWHWPVQILTHSAMNSCWMTPSVNVTLSLHTSLPFAIFDEEWLEDASVLFMTCIHEFCFQLKARECDRKKMSSPNMVCGTIVSSTQLGSTWSMVF